MIKLNFEVDNNQYLAQFVREKSLRESMKISIITAEDIKALKKIR